jgi:hypothetical protein
MDAVRTRFSILFRQEFIAKNTACYSDYLTKKEENKTVFYRVVISIGFVSSINEHQSD